jgi:hypothetical protein
MPAASASHTGIKLLRARRAVEPSTSARRSPTLCAGEGLPCLALGEFATDPGTRDSSRAGVPASIRGARRGALRLTPARCSGILRDPHVAEDATQNALVTVWRDLPKAITAGALVLTI